jgi:hypothetical protein
MSAASERGITGEPGLATNHGNRSNIHSQPMVPMIEGTLGGKPRFYLKLAAGVGIVLLFVAFRGASAEAPWRASASSD